MLPETSKILLLGWRAAEMHFLQALKNRLVRRVQIQSVAGSREEAEQSSKRLHNAGITFDGFPLNGGFTEYVLSRGAEKFFGS
jgi:hypothetical protein